MEDFCSRLPPSYSQLEPESQASHIAAAGRLKDGDEGASKPEFRLPFLPDLRAESQASRTKFIYSLHAFFGRRVILFVIWTSILGVAFGSTPFGYTLCTCATWARCCGYIMHDIRKVFEESGLLRLCFSARRCHEGRDSNSPVFARTERNPIAFADLRRAR